MKELLLIFLTTLTALLIWVGVGVKKTYESQMVSKELLEISTPINGRIDVEFLKRLENPAYE